MAPRALALPLVATMLACAALTSPASPAAAQVQEVEMPPSEVAARGHYLMGLEHYRAGRFREAAREFREAYDLSPRPELLYNLFLAHRDAGETASAVEALRAYLEASPDAENAELLRARLATLEAQLAEERARDEEAARRETEPADESAAPEAVATEPVASEAGTSEGGASVAPWIVVGAGAALLVGAAVTGGLAVATYDELDTSCPDRRCPAGFDAESRKSTGSALALTTDVVGAIGLATLGAGIVWAIVDATSGSPDEREGAAIACTPLGCRGRF